MAGGASRRIFRGSLMQNPYQEQPRKTLCLAALPPLNILWKIDSSGLQRSHRILYNVACVDVVVSGFRCY
jgi:hypothetical protein